MNNPVDDSQILRVPLAVAGWRSRGHTGGDQFSPRLTTATVQDDPRLGRGSSTCSTSPAGVAAKQYFKDNVQPILIARGCSFQACHSPAATNDFKLRTGTQGFFSAVALEKNYDLLRNDFMALEFPDVRRGRAIAKALLTADFRTPSIGGIGTPRWARARDAGPGLRSGWQTLIPNRPTLLGCSDTTNTTPVLHHPALGRSRAHRPRGQRDADEQRQT